MADEYSHCKMECLKMATEYAWRCGGVLNADEILKIAEQYYKFTVRDDRKELNPPG